MSWKRIFRLPVKINLGLGPVPGFGAVYGDAYGSAYTGEPVLQALILDVEGDILVDFEDDTITTPKFDTPEEWDPEGPA